MHGSQNDPQLLELLHLDPSPGDADVKVIGNFQPNIFSG